MDKYGYWILPVDLILSVTLMRLWTKHLKANDVTKPHQAIFGVVVILAGALLGFGGLTASWIVPTLRAYAGAAQWISVVVIGVSWITGGNVVLCAIWPRFYLR
ncbi:MAG TPA: hypothetical protein VKX16_12510 [Chloroflexota bacterium]|nr:hypothetical protein [Chloroflexota bacterium]